MKRAPICGAAILAVLAISTTAEATRYRDFVDLKRRATAGETVIRALPNATNPSFRLILSASGVPSKVPFSGMFCTVWLLPVSAP
jgi:hypothetical protein